MKRTTTKDQSDAEKEMERLLSLYPKDVKAEMNARFGEALFAKGMDLLQQNK